MSSPARYAYLHGRTSVMAAHLLSASQLQSLIHLPLGQEAEVLRAAGIAGYAETGNSFPGSWATRATPPAEGRRLAFPVAADGKW